MPILHRQSDGVQVANGAGTSEPSGQRTRHFYETQGHGIPRMDDILSVRQMERRHTVQIPMEAVIKQVTTMEWDILPDTDNPEDIHWEATEVVDDFFSSNFNSNNETFDQFLKKWARDILSINAGVVELVPTEPDSNGNQWLGEMYVRDGGTFTKEVDQYGRKPEAPEAAFYQFGRRRMGGVGVDRDQTVQELIEESGWAQRIIRQTEPIPFTKDQIVWAEENPTSYDTYGFGRVQTVKNLVEILINQDVSNKNYFTANEVPDGMLSIVDANDDQIKRFREDWRDEIQGQQHKVAIVGQDADWTPFRANPEELQFLESQQWYNKLVWMAFGISPNEVGHTDDLNLATAKEQSATIFRKTTKPLLQLIQNEINREILPKMRAYNLIDGEMKFEWAMQNNAVESIEREKQEEDLRNNLATVNDVRAERGEEDVFWGDMPSDALTSLARKFPEWFAEKAGVDDPPEAMPSLLSANARGGTSESGSKGEDESGDVPDFLNRGMTHKEARHPELTSDLVGSIGTVLNRMEDDLQPAIESAFPEESDGNAVVNVDSVVSDIDIAGELESLSLESETAVLQQAADEEADEIATQLEQRLDVAPADIKDINFDFDVTSTLAFEQLRQLTQQQMQGVENTMSRIVRNTLLDADSIQEAKDNLSEGIAQMSEGHAETVARTQLNSADRHGVQALAESTDLIGGKQWHATEDGRERSWHLAMDGVTVDKDQQFVVPDTGDPKQPDGFPRQCNIVGGCDPYNCRCRQSSVLADDMEANVFELNRADNGVTVTLDITERQYEVAREHGEGDESFRDVFERILDENTVSEIGKKGIISTATLYKWKDALD